jgi:polysaccharide pyruvyl transferase WcaK-like protein
MKIAFFGHFGMGNFGNESTLRATLYHLRRFFPYAEVSCITTGPDGTTATHGIEAVPIAGSLVESRLPRNPLARLVRGIVNDSYRWLKGIKTLRGMDMLIVPGTGLLTDAYGLLGWGPYNLFKWSLAAKICRCKLLFLSVGAGPIYGALGRWFVKSALSMADFRSYRDDASMNYLRKIGFQTNRDRVYPDLVFSLPETMLPCNDEKARRRPVVGLGLMEYAGAYSIARPNDSVRSAYLSNLVTFAGWLFEHDYDIRLLIGESGDRNVMQEFMSLLTARLGAYDQERIIEQPPLSVEQLLLQLAATDIVVATRFHNVLLALLLNKPVISISFHHKCASLMEEMGLSEYCHDINDMKADRLIEQFQDLEKNAERLKPVISQRVDQSRQALDEQYRLIFKGL